MSSPQAAGLPLATALLLALITLFHLASARAGYPHYRDIHLGTALEYAKGGIDLLRPMVVGFNASDTPTPQELPLWQALAGITFKMLGTWTGWANLLSIVLFATALWPLWQLARGALGERGAWWTLLFFLAQPLLVMMSGQASADGLSLALSIWFLWATERMIRTMSVAWLPAVTLLGVLSATTKLPLFMSTGLVSLCLLVTHAPRSMRTWAMLASVGLVSGVAFALWTRYIGECNRAALFPYSAPPSGASVWQWYIGSWEFRLNPANWIKGGWAALNCLFGSFALAALALWALIFSRERLGQSWFLAALLTTFVFTHVVLVHRHYYILFSGSVALLCAAAALRLEALCDLQTAGRRRLAAAFALAVLLASCAQGLLGIEVVQNYDPYFRRVAEIVRTHTTPVEKLLMSGGGWGGDVFMRAERRGLSIHNNLLIEDPAALKRLRTLGYTKLVMISESPLVHALQQTNPGGFDRMRTTWREEVSAQTVAWKTVFASDDVLIRELPTP